jgi:hypothetical protein
MRLNGDSYPAWFPFALIPHCSCHPRCLSAVVRFPRCSSLVLALIALFSFPLLWTCQIHCFVNSSCRHRLSILPLTGCLSIYFVCSPLCGPDSAGSIVDFSVVSSRRPSILIFVDAFRLCRHIQSHRSWLCSLFLESFHCRLRCCHCTSLSSSPSCQSCCRAFTS